MIQSTRRSPRLARASLALLLVLAAHCGDDDAQSPQGQAAPPVDAARDFVAELDPLTATIDEVLARYDVNGDRIVSAADRVALGECVAAGRDLDGYRCDIVPDGVVDASDEYALDLALGTQVAHPRARIEAVASALRQSASGSWEPPLGELGFDWNADGAFDGRDLSALADALEGDLDALDLDGDGQLALEDVGVLAARQTQAELGTSPPPSVDLNGDGQSDWRDLALMADVVSFGTTRLPGLFDTDRNGRIDERDWCIVSDSPSQASYHQLLMPADQATAAFAESTPRFSVCRADGRPITRHPMGLDTPQLVRVAPNNLYLREVASVPPGYTPADPSRAEGRQLFVVSTTPSDRAVLAYSMPADLGLRGEQRLVLDLGGAPLPANASVVLPAAVVPLTSPLPGQQLREDAPRSTAWVPLPELIAGDDGPAAAELVQRLGAVESAFEELLAGCPCTLARDKRDELVRFLLRSGHCIDATLSVAKALLAEAERDASQRMRVHVASSRELARLHEELSDDIVLASYAEVALQLVELGYDLGSGGLGKALGTQIGNLIDTYGPNASGQSKDGLGFDTLGSNVAGLENAMGPNPIGDAVEALFKSYKQLKITPEQFRDDVMTVVKRNLKQTRLPANRVEAILKTVLKSIPKWYVMWRKSVVYGSHAQAEEDVQVHRAAMLRVANLQAAVFAVEKVQSRLRVLRQGFLAKLQGDGCGVSLAALDPCSSALEAAIDEAGTALDADTAAADAEIDAALGGASQEDVQFECNFGPARRKKQRAELEIAALQRQITRHLSGGGDGATLSKLVDAMTGAGQTYLEGQAELDASCDYGELYDFDPAQWERIRDAENARKKAFDDYRAKVRDALEVFDACVAASGSTGPCSFDGALAAQSPWASAAHCLGCLPSFAMNCCGDGKPQVGEQCDPAATPTGCSSSLACNTQCQCITPVVACGDQSLTVAARQLAALIGNWSEAEYQAARYVEACQLGTFLSSPTNFNPKNLALDETTIAALDTLTLLSDPALMEALFNNSLFPCGTGAEGYTLCPSQDPVPVGEALVFFASFMADLPLAHPTHLYQYGFVFDADGNAANNYQPPPQFANDLFKNTDRWYEVLYTPANGWSLRVSTAVNGNVQPAVSQARVIVRDNALVLYVPRAEFAVSQPGFRVSAFRHTGDYGLHPPYVYDGSVWPTVDQPLALSPEP